MENVLVVSRGNASKTTLKCPSKTFQLTEQWESLTENREVWRGLISRDAQSAEERRTQTVIKRELKQRRWRQQRKRYFKI